MPLLKHSPGPSCHILRGDINSIPRVAIPWDSLRSSFDIIDFWQLYILFILKRPLLLICWVSPLSSHEYLARGVLQKSISDVALRLFVWANGYALHLTR